MIIHEQSSWSFMSRVVIIHEQKSLEFMSRIQSYSGAEILIIHFQKSSLCAILRSRSHNFGVILSSFWGRPEVIEGSSWGRLGIICLLSWDYFGVTFGIFGVILGSVWVRLGITWGSFSFFFWSSEGPRPYLRDLMIIT